MKIRFNSDDSLTLKEELEMHDIVIIVRSFYCDNNKFYKEILLDECLYKRNDYIL